MTVTACDSPDALSAALSGAGSKLVRTRQGCVFLEEVVLQERSSLNRACNNHVEFRQGFVAMPAVLGRSEGNLPLSLIPLLFHSDCWFVASVGGTGRITAV